MKFEKVKFQFRCMQITLTSCLGTVAGGTRGDLYFYNETVLCGFAAFMS